jgi:hypothetical protein
VFVARKPSRENRQPIVLISAKRFGIDPKTVTKWKGAPRFRSCEKPEDAQVNSSVRRGRGSSPSEGTGCSRSTIAYHSAADDPAPDALVAASMP